MEAAGCSYQFRIALLGDAGVGKTSLLRCYVAGARGAAEPDPEPTVGVEFYSRALQLPAGLRVKLQLWDTAGQECFRCGEKCITRSFYRNMVGVLLVFDVTNRESFEHIQAWHQEVVSTQGPDKVVFLLVGHKCDLNTRCVSSQEAEELAASLGMGFMETSAKSNCNVDLAFDTVTSAIEQALQQGDIKLDKDWAGVRLLHRSPNPRSSSRKQDSGTCQC
ncbi:ras-related protein Rab-42 isoform X1 [Mus musculus]|uniref:ras-related protein Rab-42 isoform X1 n=1 Tax=Mus musculus TaxID=10090 RepID=UPI0003D6FB22|nr:ras-related protein Rab-42 isoform X1 [Mus musculus]|eukprot:XP_006538910.1 PREDICTED: putative Ras-related protein Rab-42 isoform X1 [Mus musculus]